MKNFIKTLVILTAISGTALADVNKENNQADQVGMFGGMPVEEIIQDVKAITALQNTEEELQKKSNDVMKLASVTFDDKTLMVNYTFQLKISPDPIDLENFIKGISKDFITMDCEYKNFAHEKIGNKYVIKDILGNEIFATETSYQKCLHPGIMR